jgi:O-antigen/teichoic acid export membrane protein
MSSLLSWLAVSDFGFGGNALTNALANASGRDDRAWERELTSTAFWILAAVASSLALIFALTMNLIPWEWVFNVTSAVASKELRTAIAIAVACFLIEFPLRVASGIYPGIQAGYVLNGWNIAGSFLSLASLIWVTRGSGGLPALVLALWASRVCTSVLSTVHLFGWRAPWLRPSVRLVTGKAFDRLAGLGFRYLFTQLAGIGMYQSQFLIIAHLCGESQVPIFSVTQRLTMIPGIFLTLFLNPLMPAYGEASARGDWRWIDKTFRRTLMVSGVLGLVSVPLLLILTKPVVRLWAGAALEPPFALVLPFALLIGLSGFLAPASVLLYGLERVGKQALIAGLNAIGTVLLGVVFTLNWGVAGMAMAMLTSAALFNLTGQLLELRAVWPRLVAGREQIS